MTQTATETAMVQQMRSSEQRRFINLLVRAFERNAKVYPLNQSDKLPDHDVTFDSDIEPELKALFEDHLPTILSMFWPEGFSVVNDKQLTEFAKLIPPSKQLGFSVDADTYASVLKQNGMASFQHAVYSRIKPAR